MKIVSVTFWTFKIDVKQLIRLHSSEVLTHGLAGMVGEEGDYTAQIHGQAGLVGEGTGLRRLPVLESVTPW